MKLIEQKKINAVVSKIAEQYKPDKIILFGSYAWGKPTEDSDLDLFIIKDSPERRIERGRQVDGIIWGVGIPVDFVVYTPEEVQRRLEVEDFFIEDIMTKGKVLYSS